MNDRTEDELALAAECLDAIRLVLASPVYENKKIETIQRIIENEAPEPDMTATTSVTIFLRQAAMKEES